ncbi:MAG: helix-turn-helix domain-containing protein [Myxococcota bacterium]|nr:helix-turn-helix domain-containing protein [Myxococcota bacterium]
MTLVRLAVEDVDLMEEIVNTPPTDDTEGCEARYLQMSRGSFMGRFEAIRSDPLAQEVAETRQGRSRPDPRRRVAGASRQIYGARLRMRGTSPPDRTTFYLVLPGSERIVQRGAALRVGDLIELPPGSEIDFVSEKFNMAAFSPENGERDSIFRAVPHRSVPGATALSTSRAKTLGAAVLAVLRAHASGADDARCEHQLLEQLAGALAHSSAVPLPPVSGERRREGIRRAEAYLDENLDRAVPTHELAAVAQLPLRTLQDGFKREFGVSPYALHARLRLEAARRAFERSTPDSARVADVALAFGFTHLGRFSGDYRRCFGESPRDTLRRRPAAWASH